MTTWLEAATAHRRRPVNLEAARRLGEQKNTVELAGGATVHEMVDVLGNIYRTIRPRGHLDAMTVRIVIATPEPTATWYKLPTREPSGER